MKKLTYLLILCLPIIFQSCEELIDIDLNESDPKYVIEAELSDILVTQEIRIAQTVAFNAAVKDTPVDEADVSVRDDEGNSYIFRSEGNGFYRNGQLTLKPLHVYSLRVQIGEEVFESQSTMPSYVPVDSLSVVQETNFGDTTYAARLKFQDPKDSPNYYKYKISVNGSPFRFNAVFIDKFNDGLWVSHEIQDRENDFLIGDHIQVRRACVDKDVHRYWNEVQMTNPGSAAPGNPTSNISNGALGYFSVSSAQDYSFTIAEL